MEPLFVTLYPGPKEMVNAQLLNVHNDRWDVRLSGDIHRVETLYATFWLDPAPVNCHVRVIDTFEDPITGELRASFFAIDLSPEERLRIMKNLRNAGAYVALRNAS